MIEEKENQGKEELTEERIREIVREEIWLILKTIETQRLEDIKQWAEFTSSMGYPPAL